MPPRPKTLNSLVLPDADNLEVSVGGNVVRLTNLRKPFWPDLGITKGDLLRYYAAVSPALLPHIKARAMVMKRYPHGAYGEFFFMKRTPSPRPSWLKTCSIEHDSGNVIDFPMIDDTAALLWVVNLGCIDLNQWYARCDDVDRPDYLHFDLDPGPGAPFEQVLEASLLLKQALDTLKMPSYPKTSGSKGVHVYVSIKRGPTQKDVWTFTKALAMTLAERHPDIMTAQYRVAKRPKRPRARRLQPERMGPHARERVLGAPDQGRQRVDAGDVGRNRAWHYLRTVHHGRGVEAHRTPRRSVCAGAERER